MQGIPPLDLRAWQVVSDLRAMADRTPRAALLRMAAAAPPRGVRDPAQALADLIARGSRIETETDRVLSRYLSLCAALPDEDFTAFGCATAILLADRILEGGGGEDLIWHWDTFRPHYEMLPPMDRAAVAHGFLLAEERGRVVVSDPPAEAVLVSGDGPSLEDAAAIWPVAREMIAKRDPRVPRLRHAYETDLSLRPNPLDRRPDPAGLPILPPLAARHF